MGNEITQDTVTIMWLKNVLKLIFIISKLVCRWILLVLNHYNEFNITQYNKKFLGIIKNITQQYLVKGKKTKVNVLITIHYSYKKSFAFTIVSRFVINIQIIF